MTTVLILLALLGLLLSGVPVAFALGGLGFILLLLGGFSPLMVPAGLLSTLDSFVLIAVPLFLLMSNILLKGGVGRDLFAAVQAWVGHWPGGLAVATVISCGLFAAISGSSVATAATIATVAIPEMTSRGYPRPFVLGLLAAGGTLGILIPPSIPMIVYGVITEESIISLFLAGIGPGLLLIGLFILYSVIYASFSADYQPSPKASWAERRSTGLRALPTFALASVIVVGLYAGAFTPTEAAAVGLSRCAGGNRRGAAHAGLAKAQGSDPGGHGHHHRHSADRRRRQGVRQGDHALPDSTGYLAVHLHQSRDDHSVRASGCGHAVGDGVGARGAVHDVDHGAGCWPVPWWRSASIPSGSGSFSSSWWSAR